MKRAQIVRTIVALGGLLTPVLAAAQGVAALHDGVVIDPAGATAFVMNADGGIDALSLTSGTVQWKSRAAAKPLMMADGRLLAQAAPGARGELVLATVDAARGALEQRIEVELPAGVRALVHEGPAEAFRLRAFPAGEGTAIVAWTFASGALSGAASEPEAPSASASARSSAAASSSEGALRLALAASRATVVSPEEVESLLPETRLPARAGLGGVRQLVSADQRHTLRSERSSDAKAWQAPYRWTVADLEGATLGTIEAPVSMAPFVVVGSRLYYVAQPSTRRAGGGELLRQPLRLRALDLRSGAEQWAVPVVDTAYRGPFPP